MSTQSGGAAGNFAFKDVPFSAGNFTTGGGNTWTVDSGDVTYFRWAVLGNIAFIQLRVIGSSYTVVSPYSVLSVAIPFLGVPSDTTLLVDIITGSGSEIGRVTVSSAGQSLNIVKLDGSSWAASTNTLGVTLSVMFPLA